MVSTFRVVLTDMSIIVTKKLSRDKAKYWYHFEWGKLAGERIAAEVFTFVDKDVSV